MSRPRTRTAVPVRDKAFAGRLKKAVEGVPNIPEFGHGQQTWLCTRMDVSPEAVRKWFSGEARPRPVMMKRLADVLEVDEAWLSLGVAPDVGPKERKVRNAIADGAVNVLAGLIQMSGGHVAFPSKNDPRVEYVDLYAIVRGAQLAMHISLAQEVSDNVFRFDVPREYQDCTVVGIVQHSPVRCDFIQLTQTLIDKHRIRKGGYYSIAMSKLDGEYVTGQDRWPRIKSFTERN